MPAQVGLCNVAEDLCMHCRSMRIKIADLLLLDLAQFMLIIS